MLAPAFSNCFELGGEADRFGGAARGIVLWIEVEDERRSLEILERHLAASISLK